MSLSEIVREWGDNYVKRCQERFKPPAEKLIREHVELPEGCKIVWVSEFKLNSDKND